MKKNILFCCLCFFILYAFASCSSEPGNSLAETNSIPENNEIDSIKPIDILEIKGIQDYSSLKSIGVAIVSDESSRAISSTDSMKLVGIEESGELNVLSFLDESGEIIDQSEFGLINFRDFYSYVFFQFAPREYFSWLQPEDIDFSKGCGDFEENSAPYFVNMFSLRNSYSSISRFLALYPETRNGFLVYLLDKKTGKVYELLDENGNMIYPSFHKNYGAESKWFVTGNYARFEAFRVSPEGERIETMTNYRMSIADDELVLEELQSNAVFNEWESGGRNDRYGNCYSANHKYLINNSGQLKSIEDGLNGFMGMNDIFYVGDQWVNENGDLEAASFIPEGEYRTVNPSSPLVKAVDNTEYYFVSGIFVNKVTFLSDDRIEYTIEKIDLEDFSEYKATFYISNGRILFISGSSIAYFTPEDGKRHVLSDQYFYNSMTVRLDGTILFSGVDSNFNVVEGAILSDGTTLTAVTPAKVSMITIAPLN